MTEKNNRVLSLLAHPDDAEFMCAGTLALLRDRGWEIHIATMTPGDCGSATQSREEISRIRKREAEESAKILDGRYYCLEEDDVFILYTRPALLKTIKLIRRVQPAIVFAPSPQDYFIDHENTSHLVRTACFACGIPNVNTDEAGPCAETPYLYYVDAMEGKDIFGSLIPAGFHIDIAAKMELKTQMLCCHKSQRDWLMAHHGVDEYTATMTRHAEARGLEADMKYAEAFRQHLGHGYPQDNILLQEINH